MCLYYIQFLVQLNNQIINDLQQEIKTWQHKYLDSEKERKNIERKSENLASKVQDLTLKVREEKHMNKCLRVNQVTLN